MRPWAPSKPVGATPSNNRFLAEPGSKRGLLAPTAVGRVGPALGFEHGALGHDARLEIPPERNQQLAGEGDDPDPPHATAPVPEAGMVPARQGALRLPAQPRPRDLDRHRPDESVPGLRDPLLALQVAALIRRGREPGEAAHFAPVGKLPPAEELHHVQPRALQADRPQGEELTDLPDREIGARVQELRSRGPAGPAAARLAGDR